MAQGKLAVFATALALSASIYSVQTMAAEDSIGVTAAVNPQASGQPPQQQRRELRVGVNVVANERIVTTAGGQAQMLFRDESAFTIGPNSDVVLDEFVFDPDTQTGKIAFSATKGVFRLVGGKISKKTPVTLKTPTSTIGIRGGIALVSVAPSGATRATFLFGDAMTVESGGVVKRVTRPGFSITTESSDTPPSDPAPASSEDLSAALSVLEGGLESEEEEDDSGGGPRQAASKTNEEAADSENEEEGGGEEGDGEPGDKEEGPKEEGSEDGEAGEEGDTARRKKPEEAGSEEGGDPERAGDDGPGEGPGPDDGGSGDDGGPAGAGDEVGGETLLAADDGGSKPHLSGIPKDDDMAGSGISALGSESEPRAIAPRTGSSFEVALADTTASKSAGEIAEDANVTDSTQSSATDSIDTGTAPDATTGLTLASALTGRVKYSSNPALGSNDGASASNLTFTGATIENGVFSATVGNGKLTINAETGSFSATSSANPFGTATLTGTGNLRDSQEFLTYRLSAGSKRGLAFAGVATTDFPSTGATFYDLSDDFIMGSIVPFVRSSTVGAATLTASGTNGAIIWDDNQAASAQRPFAAAVMAKAGSPQATVVSVFVGEVRTVAGGKIIVGKMRGSARAAPAAPIRVISGSFDTATDGNGTGFFGDDAPENFVLQATPGTSVQENYNGGSSSYHPNVVADAVTDTLGPRTSRTLHGFSAGYAATETGGSESVAYFTNANGDPDDIVIRTSAETNKLVADINVISGNAHYVASFGDLDDGAFQSGSNTTGNSAFIDDKHFAAVDKATTSSLVIGNTVSADSLYLVSSSISEASTGTCTCQYLQWGHWGGQIDTTAATERVHLAHWVAGPMSTYSTIVGLTGTATYNGHVSGNVNNAGALYQAAGGFSMMVDFGNPAASTISITNFDGGSFSGTGLSISSATSGLATFSNSTTILGTGGQAGRTATVLGGFVAGAGDPAAEVGGQFTVTGTGYGAVGIVAGAKP